MHRSLQLDDNPAPSPATAVTRAKASLSTSEFSPAGWRRNYKPPTPTTQKALKEKTVEILDFYENNQGVFADSDSIIPVLLRRFEGRVERARVLKIAKRLDRFQIYRVAELEALTDKQWALLGLPIGMTNFLKGVVLERCEAQAGTRDLDMGGDGKVDALFDKMGLVGPSRFASKLNTVLSLYTDLSMLDVLKTDAAFVTVMSQLNAMNTTIRSHGQNMTTVNQAWGDYSKHEDLVEKVTEEMLHGLFSGMRDIPKAKAEVAIMLSTLPGKTFTPRTSKQDRTKKLNGKLTNLPKKEFEVYKKELGESVKELAKFNIAADWALTAFQAWEAVCGWEATKPGSTLDAATKGYIMKGIAIGRFHVLNEGFGFIQKASKQQDLKKCNFADPEFIAFDRVREHAAVNVKTVSEVIRHIGDYYRFLDVAKPVNWNDIIVAIRVFKAIARHTLNTATATIDLARVLSSLIEFCSRKEIAVDPSSMSTNSFSKILSDETASALLKKKGKPLTLEENDAVFNEAKRKHSLYVKDTGKEKVKKNLSTAMEAVTEHESMARNVSAMMKVVLNICSVGGGPTAMFAPVLRRLNFIADLKLREHALNMFMKAAQMSLSVIEAREEFVALLKEKLETVDVSGVLPHPGMIPLAEEKYVQEAERKKLEKEQGKASSGGGGGSGGGQGSNGPASQYNFIDNGYLELIFEASVLALVTRNALLDVKTAIVDHIDLAYLHGRYLLSLNCLSAMLDASLKEDKPSAQQGQQQGAKKKGAENRKRKEYYIMRRSAVLADILTDQPADKNAKADDEELLLAGVRDACTAVRTRLKDGRFLSADDVTKVRNEFADLQVVEETQLVEGPSKVGSQGQQGSQSDIPEENKEALKLIVEDIVKAASEPPKELQGTRALPGHVVAYAVFEFFLEFARASGIIYSCVIVAQQGDLFTWMATANFFNGFNGVNALGAGSLLAANLVSIVLLTAVCVKFGFDCKKLISRAAVWRAAGLQYSRAGDWLLTIGDFGTGLILQGTLTGLGIAQLSALLGASLPWAGIAGFVGVGAFMGFCAGLAFCIKGLWLIFAAARNFWAIWTLGDRLAAATNHLPVMPAGVEPQGGWDNDPPNVNDPAFLPAFKGAVETFLNLQRYEIKHGWITNISVLLGGLSLLMIGISAIAAAFVIGTGLIGVGIVGIIGGVIGLISGVVYWVQFVKKKHALTEMEASLKFAYKCAAAYLVAHDHDEQDVENVEGSDQSQQGAQPDAGRALMRVMAAIQTNMAQSFNQGVFSTQGPQSAFARDWILISTQNERAFFSGI
mmetsp:Transcript_3512/g.8439  ORF Transcript_3512/g.8439 Transcript_3512/m.8439 type:complete len:1294 (+) Transcript_3512:108-3989(+)